MSLSRQQLSIREADILLKSDFEALEIKSGKATFHIVCNDIDLLMCELHKDI